MYTQKNKRGNKKTNSLTGDNFSYFTVPFINIRLSYNTLIFIIPVLAYILTYFFNYGYYSYFNIPNFFVDYSFNLILSKLFNTTFFIMNIVLLIFFMFIPIIFTDFKINNKTKMSPPKYYLLFTVLMFAMTTYFIYIFILTLIQILPFDEFSLKEIVKNMPLILNYFDLLLFSIFIMLSIAIFLTLLNFIVGLKLLILAKNNSLNHKTIDKNSISEVNLLIAKNPENKKIIKFSYLFYTSKSIKLMNKILFCLFILIFSFYSLFQFGKLSARTETTFWIIPSKNASVPLENITTASAVICSSGDYFLTTEINKQEGTFNNHFQVIPKGNIEIVELTTGHLKYKEQEK